MACTGNVHVSVWSQGHAMSFSDSGGHCVNEASYFWHVKQGRSYHWPMSHGLVTEVEPMRTSCAWVGGVIFEQSTSPVVCWQATVVT